MQRTQRNRRNQATCLRIIQCKLVAYVASGWTPALSRCCGQTEQFGGAIAVTRVIRRQVTSKYHTAIGITRRQFPRSILASMSGVSTRTSRGCHEETGPWNSGFNGRSHSSIHCAFLLPIWHAAAAPVALRFIRHFRASIACLRRPHAETIRRTSAEREDVRPPTRRRRRPRWLSLANEQKLKRRQFHETFLRWRPETCS